MPPVLLALALALAPAAPGSPAGPASAGPSGHVSWDSAAAAARDAVARGKLDRSGGHAPLAERARASGLRPDDLAGLLDGLLAACTSRECPDLAREPAREHLTEALGELGGEAHAPVLLRLAAHQQYDAERALQRILTRSMADAVARSRCTPPSADEVAAARAGLRDFAVVRWRRGLATAEAPTAAELDDLAYFHAAVAESGPEVGRAVEAAGGGTAPASPAPDRERLASALNDAKRAGDVAEIARHSRIYLERLGFPGPLRAADETTWAWGGARFSYVLRDLAEASELLGDHALAGRLYRRADPGGGACGTSVSYRWAEQVRGAIRSAEQTGQCRAALAERLLDIDGPPRIWRASTPGEDYGPPRLAAAGFDVARLYRGALLTLGRGDEAELRAALARAPAALGQPALERLQRLGPEDWEFRVRAVEGLADVGRRAALPELVALLGVASPELRPRLLDAIGRLAARPATDPCDPEITGIGLGSYSSVWEREITPLGDTCASVLRLDEAGDLAMSLAPWLKDPDPETRRAAAEALGRIGHRAALPALKQRASDPHSPEGVTVCQEDRCGRSYPVREAVADAVAAITEHSRDDARWRRNDQARR